MTIVNFKYVQPKGLKILATHIRSVGIDNTYWTQLFIL